MRNCGQIGMKVKYFIHPRVVHPQHICAGRVTVVVLSVCVCVCPRLIGMIVKQLASASHVSIGFRGGMTTLHGMLTKSKYLHTLCALFVV